MSLLRALQLLVTVTVTLCPEEPGPFTSAPPPVL